MRCLLLLLPLLLSLPAVALPPQTQPTFDFSDARRPYSRWPGAFDIRYETGMAADVALTDKSIGKLTTVLKDVIAAMPPHTRGEFRSITFYLMWGPRSPFGGEKGGFRYITPGSRHPFSDPRWQGAIVAYSAESLANYDLLVLRQSLAHELAHAWHLLHWKAKEPLILGPYENAMAQDLYRDVTDLKGRTLVEAYARRNQLEYFAELSAAYFVGIRYQPFHRDGLKRYDLTGYRMVETMWGVR